MNKPNYFHRCMVFTKYCASTVSLILLCFGSSALVPAHAARQALVIGNAAYIEGPLKNPVNDARAMDQKLAGLGFKVQRVENMKRHQIGRTVSAFANSIRPGDEVVVFYAGHGVQVKGINYFPAVDADIQNEDDVPLNSLNLNSLMDRLEEAKAGLKMLFLDACRNNPYARSFRSIDRGLARVGSAPSGTLIHFATRPGSVAADGNGANGLYTSHLIHFIETPDTPVEAMLKRVSAAVEHESKGTQEPWTEGSIKGEFFFKTGSSVQLASIRAEPPTPSTSMVIDDPDTALWKAIAQSSTENDYRAYLSQFPKGKYAVLAQSRLSALGPRSTDRNDQQTWLEAQHGGVKRIEAYLSQFPNGQYADIARTKLRSLSVDSQISIKTRSEIQSSRALFPSDGGGKTVNLEMAGNLYFDKRFEMRIQKDEDVCRWEMDFGVSLFYYGAGLVLAGAPDQQFVRNLAALTTQQNFVGSLATMEDGYSLTVGTKNGGKTKITVGDTKSSWSEYNFPFPGTILTITRDYETLSGYLKSEEVAIYSPSVGCAVPIAQDITVINGNKMFGEKKKYTLKVVSAKF